MSRIIATLTAEGFTAVIREESDKRVWFVADADIDADGANGQHDQIAAYRSDGHGSELLANGGMGIRNGKVVFTTSWGPDIAVSDGDGNPLAVNGNVVSRTAYHFKDRHLRDPAAYVDSETVPYIVVPPVIIRSVTGIVLGCAAKATYRGRSVDCVVADVGPRTKCGELSIEAARQLGIPCSPRNGGIDSAEVTYELFPGVPAQVKGVKYDLQPS